MNKKLLGILISIIMIATTIHLTGTVHRNPICNNNTDTVELLKGNWLEEKDGVKILHLSGSHYEMGYYHGYLLKEEIIENYRAILDSAYPREYKECLEKWNELKQYVPMDYVEEMKGIADGSDMEFEFVAILNIGWWTMIDFFGCTEAAAWGPATVDEKLYQIRSWDIENVQDPVSGKYLHDNQVIIIRKPEEGYASMQIYPAGFVASSGGINEKGIGIGIDLSTSFDYTQYSISPEYRMRTVLKKASSISESIEILTKNRTGGNNFIISDGKIPTAVVCEMTANLLYIGTWDHFIESLGPFWIIDHVVRRKNFFIHPLTSITQRFPYHPKRSIIPRNSLISWRLFGNMIYFDWWRFYRTLSRKLESNWGNLDLTTSMDILQSIYRGETDLFLRLLGRKHGFGVYHQWVACPETGDMAISFADADKTAQYNKVHYFNLFDLLEAKQPP